MNGQLINLLQDGDKRTVKNVDTAVRILKEQPELIQDAIACLWSDSEGLVMRAADCLEKLSRDQAELLQPYAPELLRAQWEVPQKELRWHMAQLLPRLSLPKHDLAGALQIWKEDFYHSNSSIVRTASLQAVYDTAQSNPEARHLLSEMLDYALHNGTPAMQARARQLV